MSTGEMQHERGYMLVFFCVSVPQATISRVPCTQMNGIWPKALMKNRFSWVLGLQYKLHKPVLKKCLVLTMASRITVSCWFQGNIISLLVIKGGGWVLGLIKQCCCSCELLKWAGALEVLAMDFFRPESSDCTAWAGWFSLCLSFCEVRPHTDRKRAVLFLVHWQSKGEKTDVKGVLASVPCCWPE